MGKDKFDFTVAAALVQAVAQASSALDVKNGQLETKFGALHEGFKDSGYDAYAVDMTAANTALANVRSQLNAVGSHIANYATRLRDETR